MIAKSASNFATSTLVTVNDLSIIFNEPVDASLTTQLTNVVNDLNQIVGIADQVEGVIGVVSWGAIALESAREAYNDIKVISDLAAHNREAFAKDFTTAFNVAVSITAVGAASSTTGPVAPLVAITASIVVQKATTGNATFELGVNQLGYHLYDTLSANQALSPWGAGSPILPVLPF